PVDLDSERIYQIHYLFAAKGDDLSSRWGHAMFRLVRCAPARQQVDARCLEDVQDHIVLSFVANLQTDLSISAWKGLSGKYISQLTIKPMVEAINEYTELSFRDLQSLPLRLTEDEKRQFVHHALELYWSYGGRYYFLTNNCANESLRLIQSALPAAL